jgi:hypothetical protein
MKGILRPGTSGDAYTEVAQTGVIALAMIRYGFLSTTPGEIDEKTKAYFKK